MKAQIYRASIYHTTRNPFTHAGALEHIYDGGLLVENGRVQAVGDFSKVARGLPSEVEVHDLRGGFILPGFIDMHVHYPQVRVIGSLGDPLLAWLERSALPAEARLSEPGHARAIASEFLEALAANGTTTALVFGAHFAPAMEIFLDLARDSGLRIASGLVLADRTLPPAFHVSPRQAYELSNQLIRRCAGPGLVSYAVTPRFALSCSEAMLEVCQTLLREHPEVRFQTHINENAAEIDAVARMFPWAGDYLAVYEKFSLAGSRSVLAHNVHVSASELERLARTGAAVAHCPCSNAALGSGFFPLARHLAANVRVALGTDIGAGTGFSLLKEALQAYLLQRLAPDDGFPLTATHLLYLATRAGAVALGMEDETGDLTVGRSADFVYLRPAANSPLAAIARNAEDAERLLAAIFTLADSSMVAGTWVGGRRVHGG